MKVFILAGQSNMEGHGGIRTLDELGAHPTLGHLLKKIKKADGSFVVRDDVFISYNRGKERGQEVIKAPLTVGQGAHNDRIGPELMFGIGMGDYYQEPVLLIKTAWGGKDLYCDFRPPSAGKPAYDIPDKPANQIPSTPRDVGLYYRKMVEDVHQSLDNLATDFPQFKGMGYELCGFVWFQGWNDMCAAKEIQQKVFDEYADNFVHLVQDLRAEFKVPNLPVVIGEVGVDGDLHFKPNMAGLRAAQAKIASRPELKGTLGYVRTAPFWYDKLDILPKKLQAEKSRIKRAIQEQLKKELKDTPAASDPKKVEQRVNAAVDKACKEDKQFLSVRAEHDKVVSHWVCHYYGSARVYCLAGNAFAEAMKELVKEKSAAPDPGMSSSSAVRTTMPGAPSRLP